MATSQSGGEEDCYIPVGNHLPPEQSCSCILASASQDTFPSRVVTLKIITDKNSIFIINNFPLSLPQLLIIIIPLPEFAYLR